MCFLVMNPKANNLCIEYRLTSTNEGVPENDTSIL